MWGEIFKSLPLNRQGKVRFLKQAFDELKPLLNREDYDAEDLESEVHEIDSIRLLRSIIEHIDNPNDFPLDKYYLHHGNHLNEMFSHIKQGVRRYLRLLSNKRSMKLLEGMAETLGIALTSSRGDKFIGAQKFTHRGLGFVLNRRGVIVRVPQNTGPVKIQVCVVDEQKLPLGDFYASMLGLIVAKPEELDVVNFAIQLGLILMKYRDYNLVSRFGSDIDIYTPFNFENKDNILFANMLWYMGGDESNSSSQYRDLASDLLEEIKGALQDCFGGTQGFFK